MSATVQNGTGRLRAVRRRGVKWVGKRLTRALDRFYASQSLVGNPPVFASEAFPFLRRLEAEWRTILAELELILAHREHIPPFHAISPDQQRISKGEQWRTFFLYGFGIRSRRNCSQCPETARLLGTIPDLRTAWFSILEPGSHIPPHHGPTKGVIVFHLPLILPAEWEKCFIRVAGHIYHWALHEAYAFDDTYDHGGAQRQKSAARGTDLPRHPADVLAGPDGQSSVSGRHTAQRVRPGSVMQPCALGKPLRESNRSRTGVRRGWRSGHLLTPLCLPECG